MANLQVPLRRSQRISVSQQGRSSTPVAGGDGGVETASAVREGEGVKIRGVAKEKKENEMKTVGGRVEKRRDGVGKEKKRAKKEEKEKKQEKKEKEKKKDKSGGAVKEIPLDGTVAKNGSVSTPPPPPVPNNEGAAPTSNINNNAASTHPPDPEPIIPRLLPSSPSTWTSTPATLPFLLYSLLPTTPATTTIALNILDFTLLPANWNPRLSHNRLAAACFFFAAMLTGIEGVSATEVANASGWVYPLPSSSSSGTGIFAGPQGEEEMLRVLDVKRWQVVEGYGILWEMRGRLRECCGGMEGRLEALPRREEVEGWEEREREAGGRHWRVVEGRMRRMGFEKWSGRYEEEEEGKVAGEEQSLDDVEDEVEKEGNAGVREPSVLIDLELEEFEDFVASNE